MTSPVHAGGSRLAAASETDGVRARRRAERRARTGAMDFPTTLVAAQAGGAWAMAAIYRMVDPQLRRYLQARLGRDGEDVASDVWLDVARNLATFDGDEDSFTAWVFTIGNRRIIDHLRRRGRRPPQADAPPEAGAAEAATASAEETAFAGRLGDEAAARIVAALPDEQATVVLLRVVAGLSVEEVAGIVGRKPAHVRVLQHRALQRLAREFPSAL